MKGRNSNTGIFFTLLAVMTAYPRFNACEAHDLPLVPKPAETILLDGEFPLTQASAVFFPKGDEAAGRIAAMAAEKIHEILGFTVAVKPLKSGVKPSQSILFMLNEKGKTAEEAYTLSVTEDSVCITASQHAGLFYGLQTFLQLLPSDGFESKGDPNADSRTGAAVPCVRIADGPRFPWRGMHLDVSRHFFPKEDVRKCIDLLAMHRMNRFHWHLTDDQGWRIEIKKYPLLTQKGAWREGTGQESWDYFVGPAVEGKPRYGGFYTQDEVREIVEYAKTRYVTIVPEIEMPGHSWAALFAYPELSCSGTPFKKPGDLPFEFSDPFCAGNEATFAFLEDVLGEIIGLFPGETIHIGGDEAKKTPWEKCPKCRGRMKAGNLKTVEELQSYFIKRIERFLISRNKKPIGWDEILEGGLAPQAAVMSWRGEAGGIEAARQGHDVVMTPSRVTYFNADQFDPAVGAEGVEDVTTLREVYQYDPVPDGLSGSEAMHVLGAQACLWSENVKSFSQAERQVLPRLCALAEAVWTPPHLREWNDFQNRMQVHYARLDRMDWNYFIPPPSGFESANVFIQSMDVEMAVDLPAARIAYTLDGTDPFEQSAVYAGPVRISESLVLKARTFLPNGKSSDARTAFFTKQIPRQAVSDTALLRPGLLCRVFTGGIETLDRFSDLVYVRTDFPEKFDLPEDRPSDCFGLEFGGFIRVPRDGVYAFFTNSDDGSRLYIGQTLVVDNDGIHGENVVQGQIALSAGWHPLRVLFFENRYGELLKIGYKGPGMERREIPGAVLCH